MYIYLAWIISFVLGSAAGMYFDGEQIGILSAITLASVLISEGYGRSIKFAGWQSNPAIWFLVTLPLVILLLSTWLSGLLHFCVLRVMNGWG